jgi:trk system potassium uptake protein TrkH
MSERWSVRISRVTRQVLTRLYVSTQQRQSIKRAAFICGTFLVFAMLGSLLFWAPLGLTLRPLTWSEAWLLSVSALTASGTTPFLLIDTLSVSGLTVLMVLLHMGGITFMAFVLAFLQQLGIRIFRGRTRSLWQILAISLFLEVWVTLLLAYDWASLATGWSERLFVAFFHASSAFANAGFALTGSGGAFDALVQSPQTLSVIAVTVLFGSLGVPVVIDLMTRRRHFPQTRLNLRIVAMLLAVNVVLVLLSPLWHLQYPDAAWSTRIASAIYQSIVGRTTGMFVDSDFMTLSPSARVWMLITMFVGSAPGAMGGGVSPIAMIIVIATVRSLITQDPLVHVDGKRITPMLIYRAWWIVGIGAVCVLLGSMLLWWLAQIDWGMATMLATASFATVTVPTSIVASVPPQAWWVMSALMLWGRMGTFLLMLSLYGRVQAKQRQHQPFWLG